MNNNIKDLLLSENLDDVHLGLEMLYREDSEYFNYENQKGLIPQKLYKELLRDKPYGELIGDLVLKIRYWCIEYKYFINEPKHQEFIVK